MATADIHPEATDGAALVQASWAATALFTVASAAAVLFESVRVPVAILDLALFGLGCVAFLAGFFVAVERSRREEIPLAGLFFLAGSAPPAVRWNLLGSFALQVVVAFAAAFMRPFTPVAFGILVPVLGLALTGLWGAHHGTFAARHRVRPKAAPADKESAEER